MIKDKFQMEVKNNIIQIEYKSLNKKLNEVFSKNIIDEIEHEINLKLYKGKFFINNFETCINWQVL